MRNATRVLHEARSAAAPTGCKALSPVARRRNLAHAAGKGKLSLGCHLVKNIKAPNTQMPISSRRCVPLQSLVAPENDGWFYQSAYKSKSRPSLSFLVNKKLVEPLANWGYGHRSWLVGYGHRPKGWLRWLPCSLRASYLLHLSSRYKSKALVRGSMRLPGIRGKLGTARIQKWAMPMTKYLTLNS